MNKEREIRAWDGWMMLVVDIAAAAGLAYQVWSLTVAPSGAVVFSILALGLFVGLVSAGFFTLQPNEACALLLFGAYKGSVRREGFQWANPFLTKKRISLRLRNFDGDRLKVNDKRGNPIDISAVIVWRVQDTAKALFDVDDVVQFVKIQSDSAVRNLASQYPYDHSDDEDGGQVTLRSDVDEVSAALRKQLAERLERAGVEVEEARLNHLAYAAEIAGAMLRRQQAEAVIAARRKIVHGAVSMVEMALADLVRQKVVTLDEERKAAMVSNLLVVLCGESDAHPVINTGTLYG